MIKVTFREPQVIEQHGLIQECMFVICQEVWFEGGGIVMKFGDQDQFGMHVDNIVKITPE